MAMSRLIRPILLLAFVLAVPIVPFLLAGQHVEQLLEDWLHETADKTTIFWVVVAILSTDVLLPIPSSVVSTFAGWQLGVTSGTLASWLGMTAGAVVGFALARAVGRPLAERLVERDDLDRMRFLSSHFGPRTIVLCRALPVLAEASVLFVGAMGLSWPKFFVPTALANLGIALAYSMLGSYSADQDLLVWAFVGSVALPLLATALVRRRLGSSIVEETDDSRMQAVKPEQGQQRA
jgi:uncharacterized membrane protein YdjX (TVP38/TMEM64 family)